METNKEKQGFLPSFLLWPRPGAAPAALCSVLGGDGCAVLHHTPWGFFEPRAWRFLGMESEALCILNCREVTQNLPRTGPCESCPEKARSAVSVAAALRSPHLTLDRLRGECHLISLTV